MTKLNISQAAKTFSKDRKTIQNHIRQGKLSCEVDSNGHKLIDFAELIRVYGEPKNNSSLSPVRKSREVFPHSPPISSPIFEEKIKLFGEQIETLLEDKKELKQQLREERENYHKERERLYLEKEKLLGIIERQTLILEDKREKSPIQPTTDPQISPKKQPLFVGGLVIAIIILLIALAFMAPRIDKLYSLGLF